MISALTLGSGKREVTLDPPWLSASGFLPPTAGWENLPAQVGAWTTPAVSLRARTPSTPPRLVPFPGGILLHTGLPNPGLSSVLRRERRSWELIRVPIVVHLLAQDPQELAKLCRGLEALDEVSAVEVALGEVAPQDIETWMRAAGPSQIPVIAQFPIGTPAERPALAALGGAAAVSAGPPRGSLPGPSGSSVSGRLYGPGLLALGLRTVEEWASAVPIPILGSGGITSPEARHAMLERGASGVILDTILWTEPEVLADLDS